MAALEPFEQFLQRPRGLVIGGAEQPAASGQWFEVQNPATGEHLGHGRRFRRGGRGRRGEAARAALGPWSAEAPARRAELLWELGRRIEDLAAEFARLEALDNGKPTSESLAVDVPLCAGLFRYYAGWATKIEGETITPASGAAFHVYTRREPVGVVAAIIPWNFPLLMCGYKLGPALAAGNTVVLKPAEQTPLSALRLAQLIEEVGFPPGVVNVIPGFGPTAGAPLAAHPGVDKVTFTGETGTGQKILDAAKGNMKRLSLELGGKSPSLVFADADLDAAVEGTFGAVYFNQGQCCIAGARVYVQDTVHDEFLARLAERVRAVRLGDGLDPADQMGPLVSAEQRDRVLSLVRSGLDDGATALVGGTPVTDPALNGGFFVTPTILTGVTPGMRVMREEIFGPVAMVSSFSHRGGGGRGRERHRVRPRLWRVDPGHQTRPPGRRRHPGGRGLGQHLRMVRPRGPLRRIQDERVRQGTRPRGPGFLPSDQDRVDRPVVRETDCRAVRGAA